MVIAQDNTITKSNDSLIVSDADTIPKFPGGDSALTDFISKQISVFKPTIPKEQLLCSVKLQFIVTDSGRLEKIKILQGSTDPCGVGKDMIGIFELMPKWIPASNNGKLVNFLFLVSFTFANNITTNETKYHHFDAVNLYMFMNNISMVNHCKVKDDFYYNSGVKKANVANYLGALEDFNEALRYNPLDKDALYNLAIMKLNLTDVSGACEDWHLLKESGVTDVDKYIEKYCNK